MSFQNELQTMLARNVYDQTFVTSNIQSYIDVIGLISAGFNLFLELKNKAYRLHVTNILPDKTILSQLNRDVLITYSVARKQPGSQKMPLQERTFLSPVYVNSDMLPSGLQQQNVFKYFIDVLIAFDLYSLDYKTLLLLSDDMIEYMSLIKLVPNEFIKRGFKIPTFWEQMQDEALNVDSTIIYHSRLLFVTQLVQVVENYAHVIRLIDIFVSAK